MTTEIKSSRPWHVGVVGPVDGMGEASPDGPYMKLVMTEGDSRVEHMVGREDLCLLVHEIVGKTPGLLEELIPLEYPEDN